MEQSQWNISSGSDTFLICFLQLAYLIQKEQRILRGDIKAGIAGEDSLSLEFTLKDEVQEMRTKETQEYQPLILYFCTLS